MDDNYPDPKREENLTRKQLEELISRVGYIERVMRDQLARLYELELRLGMTPQQLKPQPRSEAQRRAPAMRPEIPRQEQPLAPPAPQPPAGSQPPFITPPPAPVDRAQQFNPKAQQMNQPLPPS